LIHQKKHQILERVSLAQTAIIPTHKHRNAPIACAVALVCADCVAILVSTLLVGWVGAFLWSALSIPAAPGIPPVLREVAVLFAVIVAYLATKGRYTTRIPFWTEMKLVVCAGLCAAATQIVLGLLNGDLAARIPALAVLSLFPILAITANQMAKKALTRAGAWTLPIVVVGDGPGAAAAEAALESDRSLGYVVVGRVDPSAIMSAPNGPRLSPVLNQYQACRLLLALDGDPDLQRRVIDCALRERVPFAIAPQPYALPACAWEATRLFSQDAVLLSFQHGLSQRIPRVLKTAMDISAAAILLALVSPVFLVVALFIRRDGGPVFFAHRRLGIEGRSFYCLKFRTMVVDGDRVLEEALAADPALAAEWEATRKLADDPRVTPIGKFLRKTSLDELPQLINVLRREMSLVGPRPIVESEVRFYGDDIAHYYGTRPGVTGLWQVSGRSNTSYTRRVQLDVWYVNNWTIWLDIAVLLKTLPAVLRREGAH
jgi:Undecaprenyl-phosphate galactose phosphotransferase WbaP